MTILLIILLILAVIYLAYQNRKLQGNSSENSGSDSFGAKQVIFDAGNEDQEDLIAERDQAIRTKNEAEQEALAFSNLLKLKNQEVSKKDQEIARLKKEKDKVETALNAQLKELKEKHSKQAKLLDTEQLENNKLVEQIERLETQISQLKKDLPGSFPEEDN